MYIMEVIQRKNTTRKHACRLPTMADYYGQRKCQKDQRKKRF